MIRILKTEYFQHPDVLFLSRDLIGKCLMTDFQGKKTGGIIVETEAYRAPEDKASHAFGGRRTKRNTPMYCAGGVCYVYLCYGIHHLFNIITNAIDIPHGILVRAIEPTIGIETMLERRNKKKVDRSLTAGPGSVCQALGISTLHSGLAISGAPIWIEDHGRKYEDDEIITGPRVGIDYAGDDALLPWRFRLKDSKWTSRPY